MDEDQRQKSSPPSSVINDVQSARAAYIIGKKLAKKIAARAAAATLGPGAIIALLVGFLLVGGGIMMFGLIGGGLGGTTAVEPTPIVESPEDTGPELIPPGTDSLPGTGLPVGAIPGPAPICGDIDAKLKSDFGIIIQESGESVSCEVRQRVYQIYTIPAKSLGFIKNLKPEKTFNLQFKQKNPPSGGSSGYTPTGGAIELTDFAAFISKSSNFNTGAFFLIHETGHLIKHRNRALFNDNYPNSYNVGQEPGCYNQGFLKTYSRRDTNPVSESMAEATALYIFNRKNGSHATIGDFRSECPATYKWIGENLYEGAGF